MDHSKAAFIRLALECNVLKFGEFTLKSGRISPYFFNAGLFYQGLSLHQIGSFYADIIVKHSLSIQHLFGPSYKGIPLATATAIALAKRGIEATVTFNRKEIKTHGEGGQCIGSPLTGNTIIIDDVITAGTAFREAQQLIDEWGGQLTAVMIALDRCERGESNRSTVEEIRAQGIQVFSIITVFDLIDDLHRRGEHEHLKKLISYQKQYGYS